jgi:hypothetical protein
VTRRDRAILAVAAALAVVVAGWLLVIQPKRHQAAKLGGQIASIQSQLDAVRAQVAQGEAARRAFAGSYTVLASLGEAVPSDDNVPSLIYQIQNAASLAHVQFNSLTLGSGGASSAASGGGGGGGGAARRRAAAPPPPPPPPPGASSAAQPLPPGASVGPAGFPIEPFTFTFTGNFFNLADFFGRLQRFVVASNRSISVSGRLMTLDAISLASGPNGFPDITATVNATTYLLPAGQGLTAGATPGGPAPQSVSTSNSSSQSSSGPPAAAATPPVR